MSEFNDQLRSVDGKKSSTLTPKHLVAEYPAPGEEPQQELNTKPADDHQPANGPAQRGATRFIDTSDSAFRIFDLPSDLRQCIYDNFALDAMSIVVRYPARSTDIPLLYPALAMAIPESVPVMFGKVNLVMKQQQDFALPTVPRGLLPALPAWAKFVDTLVVEMTMKSPRLCGPSVLGDQIMDAGRVYIKFGMNSQKVYRLSGRASYSEAATAKDELLAWMTETVDQVKDLLIGYLDEDEELKKRLKEGEDSPVIMQIQPVRGLL